MARTLENFKLQIVIGLLLLFFSGLIAASCGSSEEAPPPQEDTLEVPVAEEPAIPEDPEIKCGPLPTTFEVFTQPEFFCDDDAEGDGNQWTVDFSTGELIITMRIPDVLDEFTVLEILEAVTIQVTRKSDNKDFGDHASLELIHIVTSIEQKEGMFLQGSINYGQVFNQGDDGFDVHFNVDFEKDGGKSFHLTVNFD